MPRYANGSLEQAILDDLKGANPEIYTFVEKPAKKERKNSVRSRVNRHQEFMTPEVTSADKISAIRGILRTVERGWCSMDNAVMIIHNITKGE